MAIGKKTLFCLLVCVYATCGKAQKRRLSQTAVDGLVEGDFTDDETADNYYQTVSSNYGSTSSITNVKGWSVTAVNATIELSTNATYAYNYNDGNGTSRLNVTVTLATTTNSTTSPTTNPPAITAAISTVVCTGNVTKYLLTSTNSSVALSQLTLVASPNSITKAGNVTASMIYQQLIEYEDALSVGIYSGGALIACQDLQPPFPDFPNDWSAVIEHTDSANGTTYVLTEQYSQSMNKIRLDVHGFGTERIILTDTSSSTVTFINPVAGNCSARSTRRTNWITGEDNVTLLSTAEVLHFSQNQISYVQGNYSVRGIQCELWQASVNISNNWANATFTANFYFPVDQWLVDREDYHRLLKQVTLNGTFNGQTMDEVISYVDFRPRTFAGPTFEICAIAPYGSGCNCTNALRKAAFANLTAVEYSESDGDDFNVAGDLAAICDYGHPVPHGFISAQSGPYVGLTIIGMIGGSLITGLAMFAFYRKRGGVMISDNFRHEKFTDAPGS